jgi:hypothetical protein
MVAVLNTLAPSDRIEFIDCPKTIVRITVIPFMPMKIHWNCTLELLEPANQLREFSFELIQNLKYSEY